MVMAFALETQNLHPSTLLCLEAMQNLPEDFFPVRALDLGCGNGVLSVVAATQWPKVKIEAVDISSQAVDDAQIAAREHGLERCLFVSQNDVFVYLKGDFRALKDGFDLILCNMLADIVIPLAPRIKESVTFGGYAVVGGILAWRAAEIEALYTGLGFEITAKYEDSPWACYTLCHKTDT